jgi:hypothetical protein
MPLSCGGHLFRLSSSDQLTMVAVTSAALLGTKSGARFLCGPPKPSVFGRTWHEQIIPHHPAPTGKPLKPQVAESIGHQPFGAESSSPVFSISTVNRSEAGNRHAERSAKMVFSLVTFFGPAKKATRLPAGTGNLSRAWTPPSGEA